MLQASFRSSLFSNFLCRSIKSNKFAYILVLYTKKGSDCTIAIEPVAHISGIVGDSVTGLYKFGPLQVQSGWSETSAICLAPTPTMIIQHLVKSVLLPDHGRQLTRWPARKRAVTARVSGVV